ncbi:MAG: flavodoxin [Candidatus Cloacimonadota bacterium]|nr:MAG: flavodoxin [Candidatus Cloacimonadota bacterium]
MKVLISYGSTTGNTQSMAEELVNKLGAKGLDVTIKNVTETEAGDLNEFDFYLFGCSTWGNGELQDDFDAFVPTLEGADMSGKKCAVFGLGETSWPDFCASVDIIEKILKEGKAEVLDHIRIDGDYTAFYSEIDEWLGKLF